MSGVSLNWWSHSEIRINMQTVNKIDRIIKQQKWEVWGLTEKKGKKSILKTTEVWQAVCPNALALWLTKGNGALCEGMEWRLVSLILAYGRSAVPVQGGRTYWSC